MMQITVIRQINPILMRFNVQISLIFEEKYPEYK